MVGVVQDAVSSRLVRLGWFVGDCAAGVAVAAKAGPVAAGDFEADPVAGWKRLAVAHRSTVTSYISPGVISSACCLELR